MNNDELNEYLQMQANISARVRGFGATGVIKHATNPRDAQDNQPAIRSRNSTIAAEIRLIEDAKRAAGEVVPIVDDSFTLAGKKMRYKPVKDLSEFI